MASVDYRSSRFTCPYIPYRKATNDFMSLLRFDRKPMCTSALDCASRKTRFHIYSLMSIRAIGLNKSALKYNYLRAGGLRIQSCAAFSFHSVSAAKLNASFSKFFLALPADNAARAEVPDTTPSALSSIPQGSQYPRYLPPSYFCFKNLAVYTMNFLLAFSMLSCSSPLLAHPLLPDPLLNGQPATSESAQTSTLQEATPSSTQITHSLDTPDLPWHPVSVSWNQTEKSGEVEVVSEEGNCATCLGVVDDTLGACSAAANCVSTFDDRGFFFIPPWEFDGEVSTAKATLREAIVKMGGTVVVDQNRYMRATFSDKDSPTDDVEFLFSDPILDRTVTLRSASRSQETRDRGRNAKRLERLRAQVRWEQVPILRNRERKLVFIESPWDTFGPEPPPTFNYNQRLESAPNAD